MAEETQATQAAEPAAETTEPHGTEGTDWKAEARKWESRAKENSKAADELAKLKESQMSESERLQKRAADAEARVAELEAQHEHDESAAKFSEQYGIPSQILAYVQTADMEQFCKLWETHHAEQPAPVVHAGASAPQKRLITSGGTKLTNADVFAQLFDN